MMNNMIVAAACFSDRLNLESLKLLHTIESGSKVNALHFEPGNLNGLEITTILG